MCEFNLAYYQEMCLHNTAKALALPQATRQTEGVIMGDKQGIQFQLSCARQGTGLLLTVFELEGQGGLEVPKLLANGAGVQLHPAASNAGLAIGASTEVSSDHRFPKGTDELRAAMVEILGAFGAAEGEAVQKTDDFIHQLGSQYPHLGIPVPGGYM